MSKQAMTEILAAVANGEGASDEVLTPVSLGALRALAAEQPEVPCVVANRCAALVAKPAVVKDSLTTCEQPAADDAAEEIEAIASCLEDDAAIVREVDGYEEVPANMEKAAALIRRLAAKRNGGDDEPEPDLPDDDIDEAAAFGGRDYP